MGGMAAGHGVSPVYATATHFAVQRVWMVGLVTFPVTPTRTTEKAGFFEWRYSLGGINGLNSGVHVRSYVNQCAGGQLVAAAIIEITYYLNLY